VFSWRIKIFTYASHLSWTLSIRYRKNWRFSRENSRSLAFVDTIRNTTTCTKMPLALENPEKNALSGA